MSRKVSFCFQFTKYICLSLSRKRKLSVYADAWPEFTTVLAKITVRSRDIVKIENGLQRATDSGGYELFSDARIIE